MKALVAGACIALLIAVTGCGSTELVATVNGQPVTKQELDATTAMYTRPGTNSPVEPRRKLLESLINQKLVLQEGARIKLVPNEQRIARAVAALRKANPNLYESIEKRQGIDQYRKNVAVWAVFEAMKRRVTKDTTVTAEEVRAAYKGTKPQFLTPDQVNLVYYVGKTANQALAIVERVRSGGNKPAPGNLIHHGGWQTEESLPTNIAHAVRTLDVGETSKPLKVGRSYLVVELKEKRSSGILSLAQVRKDIEYKLLVKKRNAVFKRWISKLRAKSTIWISSGATK